jgi:5-methyltetrahydrofolate--homocysteine methyltransferase
MAISAGENNGVETLRAVEMIKNQLGCKTSLGISNVSYGLPERDIVNGAFFTMALCRGLSAAIINPHSAEIMKAYHSYRAVTGQDEGFADYIAFAEGLQKNAPEREEPNAKSDLQRAIVKGLRDEAAAITVGLIGSRSAMDIVEGEIIPALNTVGEGFENKKIYLPQLLMSAEAARACVAVIKSAMPEEKTANKGRVILATVKGDIHDIGKNIVKLVMENYGFDVTDLGKDVPPEKVLSEAVRLGADVVGLSALMTTTLPAMEETVRLLRLNAPEVKIMVGGAVMTADYAAKIGADGYAPDAMRAVSCAEGLLANKA